MNTYHLKWDGYAESCVYVVGPDNQVTKTFDPNDHFGINQCIKLASLEAKRLNDLVRNEGWYAQ